MEGIAVSQEVGLNKKIGYHYHWIQCNIGVEHRQVKLKLFETQQWKYLRIQISLGVTVPKIHLLMA